MENGDKARVYVGVCVQLQGQAVRISRCCPKVLVGRTLCARDDTCPGPRCSITAASPASYPCHRATTRLAGSQPPLAILTAITPSASPPTPSFPHRPPDACSWRDRLPATHHGRLFAQRLAHQAPDDGAADVPVQQERGAVRLGPDR